MNEQFSKKPLKTVPLFGEWTPGKRYFIRRDGDWFEVLDDRSRRHTFTGDEFEKCFEIL